MQLRDTLRHYAQVIRHRYALILIGITICTVTTLIISLCIKPIYQASALIKVNSSATSSTSDVLNNQALAVSYALLVTSPDVLQAVANKLPGTTVNQLESVVSDSPIDNTEIIEVRAQAGTPRMAADIANTVVNVFIQLQVAKEGARLQNSIDLYSQNIANTKSAIDTIQQKLITMQNEHASDDSITHQKNLLETYQSSYNYLLTGYYQLQAQKLQVGNTLSIAQPAIPPDKPDSPQVALNTILAALMSLMLMLVLALLLDWMDVTIKTTDDVTRLTSLEPLGSVPFDPSSTLSTPVFTVDNGIVEEAFAAIGLNFRALSKTQRSILVTGIRRCAGTSTTAVHLAIALIHSGKRVLLVDANLRRPVLHEVFQRFNNKGLVNSLLDVHLFQDQSTGLPSLWLEQWKTNMPNLWLLPAGPPTPYSTVILRMPELLTLQDWLLGRHKLRSNPNALVSTSPGIHSLIDYIIFDGPALAEGNDAMTLVSITEGTVLVVEAGKEQKEALDKAQAMIQRLGSQVTGVVVNRQKSQHGSYFYVPESQSIIPQEHKALEAPGKQPEWALTPKPIVLPQATLPETPLPLPLPDEQQIPGEQNTPPFLPDLKNIPINHQYLQQHNPSRMQFGPRRWISSPGLNDNAVDN